MTNEITIFPNNDNGGGDYLPPQSGQPLAPPPVPSPLQRLHRILRGRYLIAGILCTVGAIGGAVAGWMYKAPAYQVDGYVDVSPYTIAPSSEQDRVMPMYMLYVQSQVQILQSDRVIAAALGSNEWLSVARNTPANDLIVFNQLLDVGYIKQSSLIRVSFIDYRAEVANAAVLAVLKAYDNLYGEADSRARLEKIKVLESQRMSLLASRDAKQKLIDGLSQKYGTDDIAPIHGIKQHEFYNLENLLTQQEAALNLARAKLDSKTGQPPPSLQTLIDQIARTDPKMRDYLAQQENLENTLEQLRALYGKESVHKRIEAAQDYIDILNKRIEQYVKEYPQRLMNAPQIMGNPDLMAAMLPDLTTSQQIDSFENTTVAPLRKRYATEKAVLMEMGSLRVQIQNYKSEVGQINDTLRDVGRKVDAIRQENDLNRRISITYPLEIPKIPKVDKRKQFAVMGFAAGGAAPLALLLLIGLMDRRYRYSDDANADLAHLPLLGVLPNLPDRLSDPEQAAIASHCVHQIRAMLQIDNTGNNRHVWAVTSASSGDGKTSLTLSLGLSYAACGARTLLIDCDLVGAGLSSRLNIRSPQGVLDAVATRSLLQFVHSTDAADVAILPAGAATPQQASALSPAALRRLIIEAKRHFEVILIDTGPILGSIEASLVATAVDGVILTVARGQQRHLVDKAVAHLNSIGARITGIVFNRANAQDFESAISGQSKRINTRLGNGNGAPGGPFGPVARAVASSSFKEEKNG